LHSKSNVITNTSKCQNTT